MTPQLTENLEKATETFKFWYFVLLETEYMNDQNHRKEFQEALRVIEELNNKEKKEVN